MTELQPELAAALVAFQASAPSITKGRTANMGSYSYRYADLGDIWDAIREPLKNNGLAVTQMLTGGQQGFIGIETTLWHVSGQKHSQTVELPTSARSPQDIGSAITYFKRYALSAALGLSTEEDDDGAAASRSRPETDHTDSDADDKQWKAANKAKDELFAKTFTYGWTEEKLVRRYWDDYAKNLRNTTDVKMIKDFTKLIIEESQAQELDEQAQQELSQDTETLL